MSDPQYKYLLEYYRKHNKGLDQTNVLCPLSNISIYFAHILFLNFKEVNLIQSKFLLYLQQNHCQSNKISVINLLETMNIKPIPFLINYFSYCQGEVDVNAFFQFVCLFTFFTTNQIFPIILSICGIQSNISLNDSQIIEIFRQLDSLDYHNQLLIEWFNCCDRNEENRIALSTFCTFFIQHNDFSVSLSLLRCRLEQYIFEPETLYAILNRKLYYTNYIESLPEDIQSDNPLIVTPPVKPSEGCCNCLYRHIISKEPHAYLTNYYNITIAKNVNIFLNKIRSRYGYSSRPQYMSSSSFRLKSQFSDRSFRRQSKHNTATINNNNNNNNDYLALPIKSNSIKKTKFVTPPSVITTTTSFTSSTTPNNPTNSNGKTVTPNNTNTTPNTANTTNGKKKKRNSQRNSDSFIRLSNKTGIEEPSNKDNNNNTNNCYKTSRALIYLVPSNSCRFNNVSLSPKHNKIGLSKNISNSDDLGEEELEGEKK